MDIRLLIAVCVALLTQTYSPNATALSMKQFSNICHSSPKECSDNPTLQAYVGGALDLLATLDEKTNYLEKIYCKDPKELFDVKNIINYMMKQSKQYMDENAMLVFVRYFEKRGGCELE